MNAQSSCETVRLAPRQTRILKASAGIELSCLSGGVWITQYGDDRDIVLRPGQSVVLDLPTAAVMSTPRGAELCVVRREAPHGRRRSWAARLLGLFDPRWSSRAAEGLVGRVGSVGS